MSAPEDRPPDVQRIDGRLHAMHEVTDHSGEVIGFAPRPMKVELHVEDFFQLAGGAVVLAIPVAMTEEVWNLGSTLSNGRALLIAVLSIAAVALYVWALFYRHHVKVYRVKMIQRIAASYGIALLISLLLLGLLDKVPLDDIPLGLRRAVLVAWPATISATTIDFLK